MTAPRAARFYDVPAGTAPVACAACGVEMFRIDSPAGNGKLIPVDCDTVRPGSWRPDVSREAGEAGAGRGVSHFVTCSDPNRFHGPGRREVRR